MTLWVMATSPAQTVLEKQNKEKVIMSTTAKLGAWIVIVALAAVFAPQAWAAGSSSSTPAVSATSAKSAVSASSSAIPAAAQKALAQPAQKETTAMPPELAKALQMPEGKDQVDAVRTAALDWERKQPAAALDWVCSLTDDKDKLRRPALTAMASDCGEHNLMAGVDWALKHGPKLSATQHYVFHLMIGCWVRKGVPKDLDAATEWGTKQPKGEIRTIALTTFAGSLVYGRHMELAINYISKLPDADDRQPAIKYAVNCWLKTGGKPEELAPWLEKLSHDDLKIAAIELAPAWAKKDASKAQAWVGTLSLSEAEKAEILAKTK